ncbi:eukaryotic translation initiation factor 2a [Histomonas meleagridis]|uniref:eukaryotic translation initiation factor 2a n=1 Tax=Histomonas meleagridis TaxID=135588 RepID=UPI003559E5AB|nr:eukaryotic translation initiation factor 2a [Histomonas meleagridis]KAH0801631.1 eukaryotic translation initiation factor 2a [Histomonas meleagridis]
MFVCSGSADGIELRKVSYGQAILKVGDPIKVLPNCRNFTFAPNFNFVAFYTRSNVRSKEFSDKVINVFAFDPNTGNMSQIQNIQVPNIVQVKFSPKGTYFALILRKNSLTDEQKIPLIQIYKTGGELVRSFNYSHSKIPELYWSDDELLFASTYSGGIRFIKTLPDGNEETQNIELPNLLAASFSCNRGVTRFAVVYDDKSGEAKKMKIFEYPNFNRHLSYRPVMVGETFTITISPNGSSAIAIGTKNISNDSYFGETFAYYLNVQGQQRLNLKKSGPVHAVQYSQTGDRFVTIAGDVPPAVTVNFDKIGSQLEIGQFSYNSIRFSPTNSLIAIGGFGNFTGEFQVFDTQTRQKISDGRAQCTSEWDWSPCGRLILSAVLYPKMMVSNEIRIFNHMSQIVFSLKMNELTQCEWVGLKNPLPLPKIAAPTKPKAPPSAYVPPHLRAAAANSQQSNPAPKTPPGFSRK